MTPADVTDRVDALRRSARGHEGADGWAGVEGQIWRDALSAIADGCTEPEEMARAALETEKIDFSRW
ncbi:MAG TPA: hypothetical protein VH062_02040 [Polyangiaceae bacterium]|nr:hypothetical protein [Polyangiaceae bacterium]